MARRNIIKPNSNSNELFEQYLNQYQRRPNSKAINAYADIELTFTAADFNLTCGMRDSE